MSDTCEFRFTITTKHSQRTSRKGAVSPASFLLFNCKLNVTDSEGAVDLFVVFTTNIIVADGQRDQWFHDRMREH